jgi:hypothetical protein
MFRHLGLPPYLQLTTKSTKIRLCVLCGVSPQFKSLLSVGSEKIIDEAVSFAGSVSKPSQYDSDPQGSADVGIFWYILICFGQQTIFYLLFFYRPPKDPLHFIHPLKRR